VDIRKHKVLIANRGEIAVRIARACTRLGVPFVCVYTAEDESSGHVSLARELGGEAYRISSYYDANEILSVADYVQATAVHPGYGFFAENFRFARRVVQRDRSMIFIGPSWNIIRDLGDKINTKRLARSIDVPTVEGSDHPIYEESEAEAFAQTIFDKYSLVMFKASAGGGGMGIEEVYDKDQLRAAYRRIRGYSLRQFKDEGVLIERRVTDFSHIEVQILADRHGNVVHFGTRNCSIQSTGLQKRLEIAPGFDSFSVQYNFNANELLENITRHSLNLAKKVGYDNVGTWEWIVTRDGKPYLMEVNTRIQVENAVSAAISQVKGQPVDLIAEQIRLGLGEPLGYNQDDISFDGVALEYRIIAEKPSERFVPWVGRIDRFSWKEEPWLSVHTHIPTALYKTPYDIPTEFDPNLALAIIHGSNVNELKRRGKEFLDSLVLEGVSKNGHPLDSNISFLREKTDCILQFNPKA